MQFQHEKYDDHEETARFTRKIIAKSLTDIFSSRLTYLNMCMFPNDSANNIFADTGDPVRFLFNKVITDNCKLKFYG